MATVKVTERHIIGDCYRHRFKRAGGEIFEVETSQAFYDSLGEKDVLIKPFDPGGAEWVVSYKGSRFDSANGQLNPLEYYDTGINYVVRDGDGVYYFAEYSDIVNGRIDFSKLGPP